MPGSSGGFRRGRSRDRPRSSSASGSSSPGGAADVAAASGGSALVAYDGAVAPGDVGNLHAVVTTAVLGVQLVDLGQRRRALGLLHRGHVGDRPRQVGERGRGVRLPDAELLLVDEAEVRRLHQRRREAFLVGRRDQPLEPLHPRDALVVGVPGEREHAAGPQDPGDLAQGHLVVEPVEGLPAHDDVDRARADRDVPRRWPRRAGRRRARRGRRASPAAGRSPARRARRGAGPRSACRFRHRARAPSSDPIRSSS